MEVRIVVAGEDEHGKAVVVSDERVESQPMSWSSANTSIDILSTDETPVVPNDGALPAHSSTRPGFNWPPRGGVRFKMVETVVDDEHPWDDGSAQFHTTDTIDVNIVLEGEMSLLLDDGVVVELHAGDCVVQNGARHAWQIKRTGTPLRVVNLMIGADREER
jgi:hypothetical protein